MEDSERKLCRLRGEQEESLEHVFVNCKISAKSNGLSWEDVILGKKKKFKQNYDSRIDEETEEKIRGKFTIIVRLKGWK